MTGPTPTLRTAVATAVVALATLVLPTVVVAALIVVLIVGVTVDLRHARQAPAVTRTVPRLLSRGVPDVLAIAVGDGRVWAAQPTPPGLRCGPLRAGVLEIVAVRRGLHTLPPVLVRRVGPLGVGAWTHACGGEVALRVYPDLPAARRLAKTARSSAIAMAGQTVRGPMGLGTDFESLREYRPDDDVRLVNWRASARLQRPMSNTYRIEQSRRVLIALDCGRVMAAPLGGRLSRLDLAVDAAAAVALTADRLGDRVGLLAYDDGAQASVRPVTRGGTGVLRALAEVEPRLVDSDPELLAGALPRGQRTTIVIFTDLLDLSAARGLLDVLPGLVARHAVTVVSAIDDDVAGVLRRPVRGVEDAVLMAAVADLLESRQAVATMLRRSGALLIEALPAGLSAAAVRAVVGGSRGGTSG